VSDIVIAQTILLRKGKKGGGYDGKLEDMTMVIKRMIREIG
jgi:hypothetical protein